MLHDKQLSLSLHLPQHSPNSSGGWALECQNLPQCSSKSHWQYYRPLRASSGHLSLFPCFVHCRKCRGPCAPSSSAHINHFSILWRGRWIQLDCRSFCNSGTFTPRPGTDPWRKILSSPLQECFADSCWTDWCLSLCPPFRLPLHRCPTGRACRWASAEYFHSICCSFGESWHASIDLVSRWWNGLCLGTDVSLAWSASVPVCARPPPARILPLDSACFYCVLSVRLSQCTFL